MFKKIVEFFTGKKPESKFAHPLDAVTTPKESAPYKVEPPSSTTHHPGHPGWPVPIKIDPVPQPEITPIPYVPEPAPVPVAPPAKKKQTFAKKPAAAKTPVKTPAKPRAKKTP